MFVCLFVCLFIGIHHQIQHKCSSYSSWVSIASYFQHSGPPRISQVVQPKTRNSPQLLLCVDLLFSVLLSVSLASRAVDQMKTRCETDLHVLTFYELNDHFINQKIYLSRTKIAASCLCNKDLNQISFDSTTLNEE